MFHQVIDWTHSGPLNGPSKARAHKRTQSTATGKGGCKADPSVGGSAIRMITSSQVGEDTKAAKGPSNQPPLKGAGLSGQYRPVVCTGNVHNKILPNGISRNQFNLC